MSTADGAHCILYLSLRARPDAGLDAVRAAFEAASSILTATWPGVLQTPFTAIEGHAYQGVLSRPEMALRAGLAALASVVASMGERADLAVRRTPTLLLRSRRVSLESLAPEADDELAALAALLEAVIDQWSEKEAAAVAAALAGERQADVAARLRITQSAVSQRLSRAGWRGVRAAVRRWEQLHAAPASA